MPEGITVHSEIDDVSPLHIYRKNSKALVLKKSVLFDVADSDPILLLSVDLTIFFYCETMESHA